ncbi:hypothetical protein C5S30_00640 [ANME-1 cluster archaeon GoMg4]|nr:hypothetical protein [ANME-1 cluster archaeon GoMg4]
MPSEKEKESWTIDQITKSEFFHQKLHEWGLLEIAYELESIKGEVFEWDIKDLGITNRAWNKVIHRGIKPVRVFAHPGVLIQNPKRIGYYRMLAMVSQKSMSRVGLSINKSEKGKGLFNDDTALRISKHLNKIVSILIEHDEKIDAREFDLWRGMAAGSQAQGSWQNTKGERAEIVIKDIMGRRIRERKLALEEKLHGKGVILNLRAGRQFIFGSEPDIGVYKKGLIQIAVEIKGGIDPAGVLERFGAALKSLRRAKQENSKSTTILIMQGVSLTTKAKEEIQNSESIIDYFFTIEDIIGNEYVRKDLFKILKI